MIRRDPLFKGCTRPALFLGVPLAPLAAVAAPILLLAIWLTLLLLLLLPLALGVMRAMVQSDEQQFRLLWLQRRCRWRNANDRFWGGVSAYSPLTFQRRR